LAPDNLGQLKSSSSTTVTPEGPLTTVSTPTYDEFHRVIHSEVKLPQSPEGTTLMGDLSGYVYETDVSYERPLDPTFNSLGQPTGTTMPAIGGLPHETSVTGYRLSGQPQT